MLQETLTVNNDHILMNGYKTAADGTIFKNVAVV